MVDPEQNRQYQGLDRLASALWTDLEARNPGDVAWRAGGTYDPERGYLVDFLGQSCRIAPRSHAITAPNGGPTLRFQDGLVLLTYLLRAGTEGLAGRMVTARELNGGELFFTGPHALTTAPIIKRYGRDGAGLLARAATLGARPVPGGNASFRVLALPKILVGCTLHQADDEFPAGLTFTFDAHTDIHLPLDGIWALVNVLSRRLTE